MNPFTSRLSPVLLPLWAALALTLSPSPTQAEGLGLIDWDLRSLPVMGFFPMGGDLSVSDAQLNTFLIGPCIDMLNINRATTRISLLNISGYLMGVNYSALSNPNAETQVLNVGYFRAGPHYRLEGLWDGRLSLGTQLGYAVLLQGSKEEGQSRYQHGVDLSFTLSFTQYNPDSGVGSLKMDSGTAMMLAGVGVIALSVWGMVWGFNQKEPGMFGGQEVSMDGMTVGMMSASIGLTTGIGLFLWGASE